MLKSYKNLYYFSQNLNILYLYVYFLWYCLNSLTQIREFTLHVLKFNFCM